jgi:ribosomal protein L37AE/L43A
MKNFLHSARYKLGLFMADRYGQDELNRYLVGAALAMCLVSLFAFQAVLYPVSLVLLGCSVFRSLSKNSAARTRELRRFTGAKDALARNVRQRTRQFKERKTHSFYKCPNCHNLLRVPKVRGRISIDCPKCHASFERKR